MPPMNVLLLDGAPEPLLALLEGFFRLIPVQLLAIFSDVELEIRINGFTVSQTFWGGGHAGLFEFDAHAVRGELVRRTQPCRAEWLSASSHLLQSCGAHFILEIGISIQIPSAAKYSRVMCLFSSASAKACRKMSGRPANVNHSGGFPSTSQ